MFYQPHFTQPLDMFNCSFHRVIDLFLCSEPPDSKPKNNKRISYESATALQNQKLGFRVHLGLNYIDPTASSSKYELLIAILFLC